MQKENDKCARTIKISLNDKMKRLPIAPSSYKDLLQAAEQAFAKKLDVTLIYRDEDGDMINVTDDNDLAAAYADFNKLTFFTSEANAVKNDDASSSASNSDVDEAELIKMSARKVTQETLKSFFEDEEKKSSLLVEKSDDTVNAELPKAKEEKK